MIRFTLLLRQTQLKVAELIHDDLCHQRLTEQIVALNIRHRVAQEQSLVKSMFLTT